MGVVHSFPAFICRLTFLHTSPRETPIICDGEVWKIFNSDVMGNFYQYHTPTCNLIRMLNAMNIEGFAHLVQCINDDCETPSTSKCIKY